jgi:hypothetical protein
VGATGKEDEEKKRKILSQKHKQQPSLLLRVLYGVSYLSILIY